MTRASQWTTVVAAGGLMLAGPVRAEETKAMEKLTEAQVVAALAGELEKQAAADEFSGVVLLAKDGKPLFRKAYGMADLGLQVPNNPETKFNLGSINKLFTRLAIDQLAEQGKLSLDDTIAKWIPDYPNREAATTVTLRQLVDFTSGLGDVFTPEFEAAAKDRFVKPRDLFAVFADKPLLFAPGSSRQYSNAGYIVLGVIIEAVTGQSYDDYVRDHIYQPAGMVNTSAWELDVPVPNRAVGYTKKGPRGLAPGGGRRNNLFLTLFRGSPAGGGYSTVDDLLRLDTALRQGRLFKDGRKLAGLGVAGGTEGCNALFEQIDERYTLIVLANYDPPVAARIGERMRGWMGIEAEDGQGRRVRKAGGNP